MHVLCLNLHWRFSIVDIALALFAPLDLDFVVEQFLSIDNGQAAFFSLRGVDQHPFHDVRFLNSNKQQALGEPLIPELTL